MKVRELANVLAEGTYMCVYEDLDIPSTIIRTRAFSLRKETPYSEHGGWQDLEIDYSFVEHNTVYVRVVPIE